MPDLFDHLPQGLDDRWPGFGISAAFFEEKGRWLKEGRNLHGSALKFFEMAGTLVGLARLDYLLASVAFFQAIPGLEWALKLHYRKKDDKLRNLLAHAVRDGLVSDALFGDIPPFTTKFARQIKPRLKTRTEELLFVIPELRNQYFHGTYLLAPDYLHLTIQLRQIADALTTKKNRL